MKQYKFKVELGRIINGEYVTVDTKEVWEFDDDCTSANVWYDALDAFKDILQEGDFIRYFVDRTYTVKYNGDGTGTYM